MSSENLNEVYNELIMEHSMNSYNKKKLESCDYEELGHNPSCGDEITLEVKMNGDIIEYGIYRAWMCYFTSFHFYYDRYVKRKNR